MHYNFRRASWLSLAFKGNVRCTSDETIPNIIHTMISQSLCQKVCSVTITGDIKHCVLYSSGTPSGFTRKPNASNYLEVKKSHGAVGFHDCRIGKCRGPAVLFNQINIVMQISDSELRSDSRFKPSNRAGVSLWLFRCWMTTKPIALTQKIFYLNYTKLHSDFNSFKFQKNQDDHCMFIERLNV